MPFQDIDDTDTDSGGAPRAPGSLERTLRRIFVEDWGLKLLALTIALVLWVDVTGRNTPVTITATIQLNFLRPAGLDISNDPPKTVDVQLTGTTSNLDRISVLDLVGTVDLSNEKAGERVVRLSNASVHMRLPDGVSIESFQPSTVPLRLEPRIERQLRVEVKLQGQPAIGYEVYRAQPVRSTVRVVGPASHVNVLENAPTEGISVEGATTSFTASQVGIDIADQKVDVLDAVTDVNVEIGERRVEKSSHNVPSAGISKSQLSPASAHY